ncbi:MAG: hypothetical protein AAF297_04890 [Planctomycetota bacterium]
MRLSELVSSLDMWIFPTIGLIAFTSVFATVAIRALRKPREEAVYNGNLPLEDGIQRSNGGEL